MNSVASSFGALIVGVMVLAFVVSGISIAKRHRRKERQIRGLKWLSSLRSLLSHVQQHRGLCSGYLNGESSLILDIERLQREVSRDLMEIATIDLDIEDNPRWKGITQHWARLAGNFQTLKIESCLSQHNHLIKNVLYLIDDLAQESDLYLLKDNKSKPLHVYWRDLLSAAEYIGQARAIGTGVSAASYCDSVSKIRLNHLCQKIETNTGRLWKESGDSEKQITSVRRLIDCINNELLQDVPSIEPGEFFSLATTAIDSLLEQFDQLVKEQRWQ
ncbi:hypothetical protein G8770_00860 [Aestuariicella hydrocarbonica]|uniref:Nitrate/nitrite sensing protein domain-containing protein n=1 Tax=Pseudomaricurvus hydrocarbonicus TaxID=1470433 RepID=A0A9E5JT12_9GAMM|nr:hypothetical protein [Aestuariicella hydrocarbonica]NHO64095.1 hypothetical protein [Aestuariicella hydrocarbonica]